MGSRGPRMVGFLKRGPSTAPAPVIQKQLARPGHTALVVQLSFQHLAKKEMGNQDSISPSVVFSME